MGRITDAVSRLHPAGERQREDAGKGSQPSRAQKLDYKLMGWKAPREDRRRLR